MGCIGMGQAPATGQNSLRTMPRNFPGRSGTPEDAVFLCSPETATASALTGRITDPRELENLYGMSYPSFSEPEDNAINTEMLVPPLPADAARKEELVKGPNIKSLPEFEPIGDDFSGPVLLKVGDNISTDEIMPAGQRVLPFRSNIPAISDFVYWQVDESYVRRATEVRDYGPGGHVVVGGENYGQGSSREHAAIAPRYLGLRLVIAKSFARIHWQNLANFGVVALEFGKPGDYDRIEAGDELAVSGLHTALDADANVTVENVTKGERYELVHRLSERQVEMIQAGGLIPVFRRELAAELG
jgi:aconitate hydratase